MFKDIILGYYKSPSLGSKMQEYEKKLQKDLRWWIFSIFAIIFVFFTIFLTEILPSKNINNTKNEVKITSLNPKLDYSVKSTAKHILEPNDIISYTLTATNNSEIEQKTNFEINISDLLEYANLVDGSDYKFKNNSIYWEDLNIKPSESKSKIFAIKVKDKIPTFKQQGNSFDCNIELNFGENLKNQVKCPFIKNIDRFLNSIPSVDKFIILLLFVVLLFISIIMAFRSNLLYKEIRYFSQHSGEMK